LEEIDPEVEWRGALQALLESEATVYRGHDGVRQWVRDIDEALADIRLELPEIRDLGDRIVAIGRLRARGKASGAETESSFGCVVEWKMARRLGFGASSPTTRPSKPPGCGSRAPASGNVPSATLFWSPLPAHCPTDRRRADAGYRAGDVSGEHHRGRQRI
jgi:hypothetical protein